MRQCARVCLLRLWHIAIAFVIQRRSIAAAWCSTLIGPTIVEQRAVCLCVHLWVHEPRAFALPAQHNFQLFGRCCFPFSFFYLTPVPPASIAHPFIGFVKRSVCTRLNEQLHTHMHRPAIQKYKNRQEKTRIKMERNVFSTSRQCTFIWSAYGTPMTWKNGCDKSACTEWQEGKRTRGQRPRTHTHSHSHTRMDRQILNAKSFQTIYHLINAFDYLFYLGGRHFRFFRGEFPSRDCVLRAFVTDEIFKFRCALFAIHAIFAFD